jgi:hypothetical protein
MSILEEFRSDRQRVLDRLVDGELSQAERQMLLAALDDEPAAWRSCALVFLESQTWRWQFARLAVDTTLAAQRSAEPTGRHDAWRSLGKRRTLWGWGLALAASLAFAFVAGTHYAARQIAPAPRSGAGEAQIALSTPPVATQPAKQIKPAALEESQAGHTVTLALADGAGSDRIELPVAEADQNDADWLAELQSAAPAQWLDQLRQSGLEVVRRQRLFPIDLSDGRRLVVPVEEVDIRNPEFPGGL